ncbi:MAG: DUF1499 domain-containing protein [Alphaproteobacteria bacterium]|jgi:uncharacterized protein (DUF1499 family)|nr:DUF1499 domain-containing protein [Alphaproteobacteria bacterium]
MLSTFLQQIPRHNRPNYWVITSQSLTDLRRQEVRRAFDAKPDGLFGSVLALLTMSSGVRVTGLDVEQRIWYGQIRTPVCRFVDDLGFTVWESDGISHYILYSKSRIGYWDLGANRRRLHKVMMRIESLYAELSG